MLAYMRSNKSTLFGPRIGVERTQKMAEKGVKFGRFACSGLKNGVKFGRLSKMQISLKLSGNLLIHASVHLGIITFGVYIPFFLFEAGCNSPITHHVTIII